MHHTLYITLSHITINASLRITDYEIVGPAFYSNFEGPPTVKPLSSLLCTAALSPLSEHAAAMHKCLHCFVFKESTSDARRARCLRITGLPNKPFLNSTSAHPTRLPCAFMLRHAFLLERSRTIKYPSLHLQLAGDEKRSHAPPCSSTS
jgi:hypothetical protein